MVITEVLSNSPTKITPAEGVECQHRKLRLFYEQI